MRTVKHFRLHDWFAVEYCELDQFGFGLPKTKIFDQQKACSVRLDQ
jgi:hypothetical protein